MPKEKTFLTKTMFKLAKKLRNFLFPTARILLYHRVADTQNDPHLLCVSTENFRIQIKFLKENFRVVPLTQLVQEVSVRKVQNQSMAITFDDGYADNLYNALPVLEEFKIPATIFLTAGYVGQNKDFYWDKETPSESRGRPAIIDEAKSLANSRLIELGSHTLNHLKLATLPENEQSRELVESKKTLEKMLAKPFSSFAYPFGDKKSFSKKTVALVKKTGYHYACANTHERVTNKSDIFALPRFVVRNWDLNEFQQKLKEFV